MPARRRCAILLIAGACASSAGPARAQEQELEARPKTRWDIVPPQPLRTAPAPYPSQGKGAALVVLRLLVDEAGRVAQAEVAEGQEPFATAAQSAALNWEFFPALVSGEPRAAWIKWGVEFAEPAPSAGQKGQDAPRLTPSPASPDSFVSPAERRASGEHSAAGAEAEIQVRGQRQKSATRRMSDAESRMIPGAEGDPLRALEAMPGTVPLLASGPFIGLRGAGSGMVGVEFDGISIPYLFHLARGKAVVHPWLVDSAALHATGGPARYGGAAGGMIVGRAAAPHGRARAYGRVRLSDSEAGIEAPAPGGRGSVLLAGRYSYTRPMVSLVAPEFRLNYWDYQLRARHDWGQDDSIELLSFGAGDRSSQDTVDGERDDLFFASFHRVALRFSHRSSSAAQFRLGVTYARDRWDARPSKIRPDSHGINWRFEMEQPASSELVLLSGATATVYLQHDQRAFGPQEQIESYHRTDLELGSWLSARYEPGRELSLETGVRFDFISSGQSLADPAAVGFAASPRFSLSYRPAPQVLVHHQLSMGAQRPSPVQRPVGRLLAVGVGLERSVLSDAGLEWFLPGRASLDTTVFHNTYFQVADIEELQRLDGQVDDRRGQGQAVGIEVLLRRSFARRLVGFVAYTLSSSWRSVGRVRGAAQYDRRHVFDAAGAYTLGSGWSLSSRATYYSGFPARTTSVRALPTVPRTTPYFQFDWQIEKRWTLPPPESYLTFSLGLLNSTLSSDSNDMYCRAGVCEEERVGPATIPTAGLEGQF